MNKHLLKIREELQEIAEKEAMKLWRIARKAKKHGCSKKIVQEIKEEANWLHRTGANNPDRLVEWGSEYKFKFAFKF